MRNFTFSFPIKVMAESFEEAKEEMKAVLMYQFDDEIAEKMILEMVSLSPPKDFYAYGTPPAGYGCHIHFECEEWDLPKIIRDKMNSLSKMGNTANAPSEYTLWEMDSESFEQACAFLKKHGYAKHG